MYPDFQPFATKENFDSFLQCVEESKLGINNNDIKEIIITCNDDNIGSKKVIENNNGELINEAVDTSGNLIKRYRIK